MSDAEPWVCPWDICNAEQAQQCRYHDGNTKNTRGCGHMFPPGTTPEQARRRIGRPVNRAPAGMSEPYSEFEIWEGEADESLMSASTSGQRSVAWREARHYAAQYAQDGPVRICEVTRRWLHPEEIMSAAAPAMREPAPSAPSEE